MYTNNTPKHFITFIYTADRVNKGPNSTRDTMYLNVFKFDETSNEL